MRKRLWTGLALALALLLSAACGRKGREQTSSHAAAQPSYVKTASNPSGGAISNGAVQPENANSVEPRPSPFVSAPARRQSAGSRMPAPDAQKAAEPLVMATTAPPPPVNAVSPALPPPPVVKPAAPDASQLPPVLRTLCCVSTATYEPVRPNGFQRALQKVPGLRRLDMDPAAEPGYAPPQPVRDVRFAITPDSSPMLMRAGRMDLRATVDASGRVTRVALLSPRDEKLADLVAAAAREWRFAPAEVNGSPVPGDVMLHFDFDNTPAAQASVDVSKVH